MHSWQLQAEVFHNDTISYRPNNGHLQLGKRAFAPMHPRPGKKTKIGKLLSFVQKTIIQMYESIKPSTTKTSVKRWVPNKHP